MNRPAKGDYQSVRNFMYNHKPLGESEASWVNHEEDIITLRAGREHAWLDTGIEKILKLFHCSLLERLFGDEVSPNHVFVASELIFAAAIPNKVLQSRGLLRASTNRASRQLHYHHDDSCASHCSNIYPLPPCERRIHRSSIRNLHGHPCGCNIGILCSTVVVH